LTKGQKEDLTRESDNYHKQKKRIYRNPKCDYCNNKKPEFNYLAEFEF